MFAASALPPNISPHPTALLVTWLAHKHYRRKAYADLISILNWKVGVVLRCAVLCKIGNAVAGTFEKDVKKSTVFCARQLGTNVEAARCVPQWGSRLKFSMCNWATRVPSEILLSFLSVFYSARGIEIHVREENEIFAYFHCSSDVPYSMNESAFTNSQPCSNLQCSGVNLRCPKPCDSICGSWCFGRAWLDSDSVVT